MPKDGVKLLKHSDILSFEEIVDITKTAVEMGVAKVRLTGGEPLLRRGILDLVAAIGAIEGIEDFAMTTNGILLPQYAQGLADAGLKRVNISLDTIDADRYQKLTRCGNLADCLAGIEAAKKAGLTPIKLNCVVGRLSNESDSDMVRKFGVANGLQVRIIREMIFETGGFSVVEGGIGGDCARCNRLRLSSDGIIRPCLFSDTSFSVRQLGHKQALKAAIAQKPKAGGPCSHNLMHQIGG
jgi:cyclic pyranopterin phosphate synthase